LRIIFSASGAIADRRKRILAVMIVCSGNKHWVVLGGDAGVEGKPLKYLLNRGPCASAMDGIVRSPADDIDSDNAGR
jgi:hypothetical protein